MDIIYIIFFILIIVIVIITYRTIKDDEKFDNNSIINSAVINSYKNIDIDAMRNLSQISNKIYQNDNLTIPSINSILKNVNIINDMNCNNMKIDGNLDINGNFMFFDGLLQGSIYFWLDNQPIPLGWAPCDGNKYIINKTTSSENQNNYIKDDNGYLTPNLIQYIFGYNILNSASMYERPQDIITLIIKIL